jgi:hypothetical protein
MGWGRGDCFLDLFFFSADGSSIFSGAILFGASGVGGVVAVLASVEVDDEVGGLSTLIVVESLEEVMFNE